MLAEHRARIGAVGSGARARAFLRCGRAVVELSLADGDGDGDGDGGRDGSTG